MTALFTLTLAASHEPLNIAEEVLGPTSFRLTWDPPPEENHHGVIRGYRVYVTEIDTGRELQFSTDDSETEIIVENLHPYYLYNCSVAAITIAESPHRAVIGVRTAEAGTTS